METAETNILAGYITKAELAAQLHRSIRTIDRLVLTGDGPPCIRIGAKRLYRRDSVIAWLRDLETPGRPERKQRRQK